MFDQYVVNRVIITCWSLPSDTDRAGKPFVIITGGGSLTIRAAGPWSSVARSNRWIQCVHGLGADEDKLSRPLALCRRGRQFHLCPLVSDATVGGDLSIDPGGSAQWGASVGRHPLQEQPRGMYDGLVARSAPTSTACSRSTPARWRTFSAQRAR